MTQPSDGTDFFCPNWAQATDISLRNHLSPFLNLLPDSSVTGSEVRLSSKFSEAFAHDRPAAILVSFLKVQNEWHILMTKRAPHLAHHAGQISFPGGKVEPSDSGAVAAALREAYEEVHLAPELVKIIGGLDLVRSPAGYVVQPVVGIVSGENRLRDLVLDPMEVELIFTVPVMHLANPKNLRLVTRLTDGRPNNYWVIEHPEHFIWGLSAKVLIDLSQRLTC